MKHFGLLSWLWWIVATFDRKQKWKGRSPRESEETSYKYTIVSIHNYSSSKFYRISNYVVNLTITKFTRYIWFPNWCGKSACPRSILEKLLYYWRDSTIGMVGVKPDNSLAIQEILPLEFLAKSVPPYSAVGKNIHSQSSEQKKWARVLKTPGATLIITAKSGRSISFSCLLYYRWHLQIEIHPPSDVKKDYIPLWV